MSITIENIFADDSRIPDLLDGVTLPAGQVIEYNGPIYDQTISLVGVKRSDQDVMIPIPYVQSIPAKDVMLDYGSPKGPGWVVGQDPDYSDTHDIYLGKTTRPAFDLITKTEDWVELEGFGLVDDDTPSTTKALIKSIETIKTEGVDTVNTWYAAKVAAGFDFGGNTYMIDEDDLERWTQLESALNAMEKGGLTMPTHLPVFDNTGTQNILTLADTWSLLGQLSEYAMTLKSTDIGSRKAIEAAADEANVNAIISALPV